MKKFLIGVLVGVFSSDAAACTSCLCGDPTLTTLGTEKPYAGRVQFSYEVLQREEETGQKGVNFKRVEEVRHLLNTSYWPNKSVGINLSLPVNATLNMLPENGAEQEASGLGDADINARYYQWQNRKMNAGWIGGLRLPTGSEQTAADGRPIDIDAQPSQGVTFGRIGGWYSRYKYPWSFHSSVIFNAPFAEGYQGFKPGNQVTYSGIGQYAFSQRFSGSAGLEGRSGEKDQFYSVDDGNSGGTIIYLAASVVGKWHDSGLWHIKGQYAVVDELNGFREEPYVIYAGIGYGF